MPYPHIEAYRRNLARLIRAGKSPNETALRKAFLRLVEAYGEKHALSLVDELPVSRRVRPDATLRTLVGLDVGFVENKDRSDDLELEIRRKLGRGYPTSNILFENGERIVLIQNGKRVKEEDMESDDALDDVINRFVSFERPEITKFKDAIVSFARDIPDVVKYLRLTVDSEFAKNAQFRQSSKQFLEAAQKTISTELTLADVREMIIQHFITEDIFLSIFSEKDIHDNNNVSKGLRILIDTFYKRELKKDTLYSLRHYYDTIKIAASSIEEHSQKQDFLKVFYEEFYKAYNPKKADKQGIVYTPISVVNFMIKASDYLIYEHFEKTIASADVDVLDPCAGTGVFVTQLLKHLEGNKRALERKYAGEIHCNEIDLLPYYIANLNIEYIYHELCDSYKEFEGLCLVDTLDNDWDDKHKTLLSYAGSVPKTSPGLSVRIREESLLFWEIPHITRIKRVQTKIIRISRIPISICEYQTLTRN